MKNGSLPSTARLALLLPLLGLALLTPGTSFASGGSTLPGQGRETRLRLMQNGAEESDGLLPRLLRVPAELGLGALGGVGLGVSGALLGALLTPPASQSNFRVLLGGGLGFGVGVTLGVWGAGRLAGSNGSLLATSAGTAAGMLVAVGISSLFPLTSNQMLYLLPVPLIGAVVGHELSAHRGDSSPTPTGAAFTLGGRF